MGLDIKIDVRDKNNFSLKFLNGDLLIGDSTNQDILQLIIDNPNDTKSSPNDGFFISQYINSTNVDVSTLLNNFLLQKGYTQTQINNFKIS